MTYTKKYRVFLFETDRVNNVTSASLVMSQRGYLGDNNYSDDFDTEEEAIEFCFEKGRYMTWIIVPQITFD